MSKVLDYESIKDAISVRVEKLSLSPSEVLRPEGARASFDWANPRRVYKKGRAYIQVQGTCPNCEEKFWVTRANAEISKAGLCTECYKSRKGKKHPRWKIARSITNEGYVRIWIGEDHKWAAMGDASFRAFEHRVVMAEKLGRLLGPREHVHHINGNKQDNGPENLALIGAHSHNLLTKTETRIKLLEDTLARYNIVPPEERQKVISFPVGNVNDKVLGVISALA